MENFNIYFLKCFIFSALYFVSGFGLTTVSAQENQTNKAISSNQKTGDNEKLRAAIAAHNAYKKAEAKGDGPTALKHARVMLAHGKDIFGENSLRYAVDLNMIAGLLQDMRRFEESEKLYNQALAISKAKLDPLDIENVTYLNNLAQLLVVQKKYEQAEPHYRRALEIREAHIGTQYKDLKASLENMSDVLVSLGKYAQVEAVFRRTLAVDEAQFGYNHQGIWESLAGLTTTLLHLQKMTEAEPIMVRALAISEEHYGSNHPNTATSVNNLGSLLQKQRRLEEAEPFLRRALVIRQQQALPNNADIINSLNNMATLLFALGRYDEAEHMMRKTIALAKIHYGPHHPRTLKPMSNLGVYFEKKGRWKEAEPLFRTVLSSRQNTLDPNHPDIAASLLNLSTVMLERNPQADVEKNLLRAINIFSARLGYEDPRVASSQFMLATYYRARYIEKNNSEDFVLAYQYYKLVSEIWEKRILRKSAGNTAANETQAGRDLRGHKNYFYNHALATIFGARVKGLNSGDLRAEGYQAAQWAQNTTAGAALAQAAARFSANNSDLAVIIRQRQDLANQWPIINKSLIAALMAIKDKRDEGLITQLNARLISIDTEIDALDARLESGFPEYTALTSPAPLSLKETQALINNDEALIMFLAGEHGTIIFTVTKTEVKWAYTKIDASEMSEAVRVLRISLEDPDETFPRNMAHMIYKSLLGNVAELIADKKHVFIVPSGALNSIPLGVLVTQPPEGDDADADALRATSWWGTQQALTTLPSVASLKALRLLAKEGRGREPFAGFGDPILTGPKDAGARERANRGAGAYFRGGTADVEALRTLSPLPQTANEVRLLAKALKTRRAKKSIFLGARATETNVKQIDLSQKRVVVFATHGLMSGEMNGLAEPALVLTPPVQATPIDDGLLTASEAAQLNLNADWVILSACNTAASDAPGADGLSGLARAFFYAGAKAMLVSHWPVRDDAAARLTTGAIGLQKNNPAMGRAEALRRSMVLLMNDTSDDSLAHPSIWAPFVVVGEGGIAPKK